MMEVCSQCGGDEDKCASRRCWGFVNGQRKKSYLAQLRASKNTDLPSGWRYNQDKDGRFAEYHHGDAIMRADDKMWIVRVGLNTESGKCHSIESGIESARLCLLRRINLAIKALGCEVKLS